VGSIPITRFFYCSEWRHIEQIIEIGINRHNKSTLIMSIFVRNLAHFYQILFVVILLTK